MRVTTVVRAAPVCSRKNPFNVVVGRNAPPRPEGLKKSLLAK